jgi:VanZ family protein
MLDLLQRHLKNPRLWRPRLWQLVLACYWLALFLGTHLPIDRLALHRGSADKFAHIAAFGGLAILVAITWRLSGGRLHARQLIWVWIIVVLYGAIEETTQPLVNRSASLIDWMADALGATLGLVVFWWWLRRWLDKAIPASNLGDDQRPIHWRRFSLRTIFVVMTFVAVACYWMMLPTINAQRFVHAIQTGNYASADNFLRNTEYRFFEDAQTASALGHDPVIWPLTWRDLWNGQRHITLPLNAEAGGERVHFRVNRQGVVTATITA